MRIVYLAAGAGGMYCGACLHDNTLAAALLRTGQDVLLVPTYTPLRTDEKDVSQARMFFGGVNVYLQQSTPLGFLFRHTPWKLDALLDSPRLMRFLTRKGPSVDPAKLGGLTVSMLRGEEGRQRKELEKLVHWLETEIRPDVVHLSNAILSAMARQIAARLRVPVVCGLAGEDVFLERLVEPHYSQARELLRERARDVSAWVSLNRYYADTMIEYMQLDPHKVHVIPHGLDLTGHGMRSHAAGNETIDIGYFARITPDKGLHHLVEAFRLLCRDESLPPLRLRAAGYLAGEDKPYLAGLEKKLSAWGLADRFRYEGEPDRAGKIAFLQSLDVMSLPTVYRESKGLSVLEALANAVPVVLPAHGAFPELIADTHGGVLHAPDDPAALAEALKPLLRDRQAAAAMGLRGQQAVRDRYHADAMARRTMELYARLAARGADS